MMSGGDTIVSWSLLFEMARTHQIEKENEREKEKVYISYEHVHHLIEKSRAVLRTFDPDVIVRSPSPSSSSFLRSFGLFPCIPLLSNVLYTGD